MDASHHEHVFNVTSFKQPTFCTHCDKLLIGLCRQGQKCKECNVAVHSNCRDLINPTCFYTGEEENQDDKPHNLKVKTYLVPTYCRHCGTLLYGIIRQGQKCQDCKMNFHKRCGKNIPHDCASNMAMVS